jgi:outer membrane protein assembly factor BamB
VILARLGRVVVCLYGMAPARKAQPQTFSFRDLTIWSTRLPDVQHAVHPPSNNRPNPLATHDTLYVSVFFPGAVCALDRDRGKLIWRRELANYADSAVHLYERKLLAGTSNALFALRPDSGEILWSFCPYGNQGESIYSSPSAHDNRVYIGDRRGYLHCLDAASGKTIWKKLTSRARNASVNSTPVLMDGLVIVSTNARTAFAYSALSGKLEWQQKLDGPSSFGPLAHQDSVLAISNSLYVLNSRTGRVRRRFSWSGLRPREADRTPQGIVLTFWPVLSGNRLSMDDADADKRAVLEAASKVMIFIAKSGLQRTHELVASGRSFRYVPATRLMYLSGYQSVDALRPATGTVLCRLNLDDDTGGGIAPVDVKDKKLYALTGDGSVYALRHP